MIKKIESILIIILASFLFLTLILRMFNITTRVVVSDSMYPAIKTNDLVYLNENINYDFKVGDIISFNLNSAEVLHRIVEINEFNIVTKGDNNNTADLPINKTEINAKYLFKIPFGGYLFNLNLWIILIGLYGILYISRLIIKEFKKE